VKRNQEFSSHKTSDVNSLPAKPAIVYFLFLLQSQFFTISRDEIMYFV